MFDCFVCALKFSCARGSCENQNPRTRKNHRVTHLVCVDMRSGITDLHVVPVNGLCYGSCFMPDDVNYVLVYV